MAFLPSSQQNRRRGFLCRHQSLRPGVLHLQGSAVCAAQCCPCGLHRPPSTAEHLSRHPCSSSSRRLLLQGARPWPHQQCLHRMSHLSQSPLSVHSASDVQVLQQQGGVPSEGPRTRRPRLTFSRWNMMISSRYKTELCRQFLEDGDCPFEDKCLFAHGQEEVRALPRHPKYKTELCRDFHQAGFCSFGPRCNFIHSTTDVATLSAQLTRSSTPDSGNESSDDFALTNPSSVVCSPPFQHNLEENTFFGLPESWYLQLTDDDCSPIAGPGPSF